MLQVDLTFIAVFVLVWVLVIVLGRVFFKPYLNMRERRRNILEENERTYRQAMKDYESHLQQVESGLKEARQESQLLREKIVSGAMDEKARLLADIQAEVKQQVAAARVELSQQTEKLKDELGREVEGLARQLEEKILH
ncbi:MAG: ATP synthase F0 subunit B [Candidatus Aminicenantes bacterium]|nr:ATP synthase F0 subunit B [Candidatus Aminicenantes bacterium]